jgi:hypothetical protein
VELWIFKQLSQLDPVVKVIELMRLISRMLPQSRGLMAAACKARRSLLALRSFLVEVQDHLHISTKALRIRLFFPLPEAAAALSEAIFAVEFSYVLQLMDVCVLEQFTQDLVKGWEIRNWIDGIFRKVLRIVSSRSL